MNCAINFDLFKKFRFKPPKYINKYLKSSYNNYIEYNQVNNTAFIFHPSFQ